MLPKGCAFSLSIALPRLGLIRFLSWADGLSFLYALYCYYRVYLRRTGSELVRPRVYPRISRPSRLTRKQEGLTRAVFKNGLTAIVEEYPSTPLVAVVTLVKLGDVPIGIDPELVAEFAGQNFREKINSFGGFGEVQTGISESIFASVIPSEKILDALESHVALFTPRSYDAEEMEFLASAIKRSRKHRWKIQPTEEALMQNFFRASETSAGEVPSKEKYREFYRAHYHRGT